MSSRKDELLAKKARLAELKRQRELRQGHGASSRLSLGGESSPGKTAEERRFEIDSLVSSLIDRQKDPIASASRRESGPSSLQGTGTVTPQDGADLTPRPQMQSASTQILSIGTTSTVFEEAPTARPAPAKTEYITYTKGVQTEPYTDASTGPEDELRDQDGLEANRRHSKRNLEQDEDIRASLRKEIEEELRVTQNGENTSVPTDAPQRFPLRTLTNNELNAVTASSEFVSFVERSSKVIERALDDEYDILADYSRASAFNEDDDDDMPYSKNKKKSHSLREVLQLHSDRTRRRIISDIQYSPHFDELLLSSYTKNSSAPNDVSGLVLLWNTHAPSRPEYTFTANSDVLCARFSPFHPNLVIGGCYNGQICIWDTRISGRSGLPAQKTSQSGSHLGHSHPIYDMSIIGTPNAHNILSASMDGLVCSWSADMLAQAQEYLPLSRAGSITTDEVAPTSLSFPASDPTFFLVGTEEGPIYPCHRYDRAGAKAGIDNRLHYAGHTAPVMSTQFHPGRGPVDLGDLLLSSSSDWSIKLWRIKPAASSSAVAVTTNINNNITNNSSGITATTTTTTTAPTTLSSTSSQTPSKIPPLLDIPREDLVYDAKWHPHRPSIFAAVTGAGDLEVFDLLSTSDIEVPVSRAQPSQKISGNVPFKSLNKVAWEQSRGSQLAVGGLDGVVTVFDVGRGLQGSANANGTGENGRGGGMDEWIGMKRLLAGLERAGLNGAGGGGGRGL